MDLSVSWYEGGSLGGVGHRTIQAVGPWQHAAGENGWLPEYTVSIMILLAEHTAAGMVVFAKHSVATMVSLFKHMAGTMVVLAKHIVNGDCVRP